MSEHCLELAWYSTVILHSIISVYREAQAKNEVKERSPNYLVKEPIISSLIPNTSTA